MFGGNGEDGRPSIIGSTLKSVVVIGALSYLAAGWLSAVTHDNQTLSRLAQNVSKGLNDPLTTGSIDKKSNAVRLDPCIAGK